MTRLLLALVLLAAALAGCGDSSQQEPAGLAPKAATLYAEVELQPEGDQRAALDDLAAKLPGTGDSSQKLARLLDETLRDADGKLSFRNDIQPWLGERAAYFGSGLSGDDDGFRANAALIATKDEEKALDAVDKAAPGRGQERSYEGADYRSYRDFVAGVHDGYLIVGDVRGFRAAVDASNEGGDTLKESDAYKSALEGSPTERLGTFFFNSPELLRAADRLGSGQMLGPFRKLLSKPYVATAAARSDGLTVDSTLPPELSTFAGPFFGRGSGLVSTLPADSWAAFGQPDLGKLVGLYVDAAAGVLGGRENLARSLRQQTGLDLERDILGWMGDFGVFVRGTSVSTLDGALVLETKDPAASQRALAALGKLLRRERDSDDGQVGPLTVPGGGTGFSVAPTGDMKRPFHVFQRGDRVLAAYGDTAAADAVDPKQELKDSAAFRDAAARLGDGFEVSTFFSVPPILRLAEAEGASEDADYRRAKPYLEALDAAVAGTKKDGDRVVSRSWFGVR